MGRGRRGKSQAGEYLGHYAESTQWACAAGTVEQRPAMLVYDREVSLQYLRVRGECHATLIAGLPTDRLSPLFSPANSSR
jgi:hypothetical protein